MKRLPWYSAVLYMFGFIFGLYTIWALVEAIQSIMEAMRFGQLRFFEEPYLIISYLAGQFGIWVVYTLVLLALGRVLHLMTARGDELYLDEDLDLFGDEDDAGGGGDLPAETGRGGDVAVAADHDEVEG
jgi:hypothetical protein